MAGHLWSMLLLVGGTAVALATELLAAGARAPLSPAPSIATLGDLGGFVTPVESAVAPPAGTTALSSDPFAQTASPRIPVAPGAGSPTVKGRGGRQLTAILIADDRPVAVIDGAIVNVGDVLPDGGRIAAIRADRVAISERNGQMRVLTIGRGGGR